MAKNILKIPYRRRGAFLNPFVDVMYSLYRDNVIYIIAYFNKCGQVFSLKKMTFASFLLKPFESSGMFCYGNETVL